MYTSSQELSWYCTQHLRLGPDHPFHTEMMRTISRRRKTSGLVTSRGRHFLNNQRECVAGMNLDTPTPLVKPVSWIGITAKITKHAVLCVFSPPCLLM